MKRKKKDTRAQDFIDALADVIADRVAAKLEEAKHPPPIPDRVPTWVSDPRREKVKRAPEIEDGWTPEMLLHSMGMIRHGEPGYEEALKSHLARQRAREGEVEARARMRKPVRLLEKLFAVAREGTERSRRRAPTR